MFTPAHFLNKYFVAGISRLLRTYAKSFWRASTAFQGKPYCTTKSTSCRRRSFSIVIDISASFWFLRLSRVLLYRTCLYK
ncbi:hypothetical protein V5799_030321 [Amblyomma americanum]|uniref:Uncharacterized protein n=1 Tax=Amblyomma americanum TaxID=6943 RepID=A0AAQ4ENG9_AMBAM